MTYPNPYPVGQCTWGCGENANWCLQFGNLGNAYSWPTNWKLHGGGFSLKPTIGNVVCFEPGIDGADTTDGHVAVVTAINPDGTINVTEWNFTIPLRPDTRSGVHVGPGVSFLLPPGAPTEDHMELCLLTRNDGTPDPSGPGAVYLCLADRWSGGVVPAWRRHIASPADEKQYTDRGKAVEGCPGYLLDRAVLGAPIAAGDYPVDQGEGT